MQSKKVYILLPSQCWDFIREADNLFKKWLRIGGQKEWDPSLIQKFDVWLDGRIIQVSRKLYRDLMDTELDPRYFDTYSLSHKMARNGSYIEVMMLGSDGAGTYALYWHIARRGNSWRRLFDADDADWPKKHGFVVHSVH